MEKINNNTLSFEKLFDTYYDKIYRYAYSILLNRENAEDVVSDTFYTAYLSYDNFDCSISSPATWLTRIAHNKAVDMVKSAAYRKNEALPEDYDVASTEDFTDNVVSSETMHFLYSKLSLAEREFLDLRYVMGMKDAQVAELMDLPVKTVNKRYQRLLGKCKEILEEKE